MSDWKDNFFYTPVLNALGMWSHVILQSVERSTHIYSAFADRDTEGLEKLKTFPNHFANR